MAQRSGSTMMPRTKLGRALAAVGYLFGTFLVPEKRFSYGLRFVDIMAGDSFETFLAAFESHPDGRALLEARPDTQGILADRADLGRRPAGSFGRSYFDFLATHKYDDGFYFDLAKETNISRFNTDPKRMWLRVRSATHDVRHVLTGYGPDYLGETCLFFFRLGQIPDPGLVIFAACTAMRCLFQYGPAPAIKTLMEAYRRGRASVLVDLCPFEFVLSEPLESCRAKLRLAPAPTYESVLTRQSERRAQNLYTAGAARREP